MAVPEAVVRWCGRRLATAAILAFALAPRGAVAGAGADSPQGSLRARSVPAELSAAAGRRLFSTGTSFCYEKDSKLLGNCWQKKPPSNSTPTCTPRSGKTACLCPAHAGVACLLDELPTATGRCAQVEVYVPGGEKHVQANTGFVDVTGSAAMVYCREMVHNDEWEARGLVASSDDGPAESGSSWWRCWYPYTWQGGRCRRRTRFLGESCWNAWANPFVGTAGVCAGSDTSYGEYSTSCYGSVCVPYAMARERDQCSCAWVGWNFLVACTAAGNACGGHACVLSTGDGKKYCDYATSQDW